MTVPDILFYFPQLCINQEPIIDSENDPATASMGYDVRDLGPSGDVVHTGRGAQSDEAFAAVSIY